MKPLLSLHDAVAEEQNVEVAEKQGTVSTIEECFGRAIHMQSLRGRCQEALDSKLSENTEDVVGVVDKLKKVLQGSYSGCRQRD